MTSDGDEYAIFLNGSYGVGKSSTLDHIGDLLADRKQPFSLMDVDWYHRSWPPADPDSGNQLIEAQNMAFVWSTYRSIGPRQLIMSGVITDRQSQDRYAEALGLPIRTVRLVASPEVIERRLRGRYTAARSAAFEWHRTRHEELSATLADANLDEIVIDTDLRTAHEVARLVLSHFGYACPPAH